MNIFKRSIHKNLLIIMGSLISLTISGCDKTESTPVSSSSSQQVQDAQSQPVQNNAQPTKDEQTTEATDDRMPVEPVPDEITEIQQDNPQSKELDWNNPEHLNTIAAETQKAYNELISLASEFASCYRKAQKVCTDKGIRPFGSFGMNQLSYNLEYDEFGNIYYIEDSFAKNVKKWERCETTYDSCFRKKLPKSFNFDLSEIVKNYPNNVQRFGRIKLVFNITTNKVSIIDAYSKPIGTVHQNNVNSFGESYNKHYERWLKRREK